MFRKVLIANRGAIACRIIRTLKKMGIASVAVYAKADEQSLHVLQADEAVCLGEGAAAATYLDAEKILDIARHSGAEAIHPGYGFLSENAGFAERCADYGIIFIGPRPEHIRDFGLKHTARELADVNAVPLLPGTGLLQDAESARHAAASIGYPVMLKSTAGGGGIGMQLCHDERQLVNAYDSVKRLSRNNFSNEGIFLEKYVERARHIEVQIFGDGKGGVVALGERDCSLQRRNQKVIEETPAPGIGEDARDALLSAAVRLGRAVDYLSAGTVEFIYDSRDGQFYFLEVNTRLQVEHGVTEAVTGVDLVEWMVRQAAGENFIQSYHHCPQGVAVQARVYAENPAKNFQPSSGLLTAVTWPDTVRCDHWVEAGLTVSPFFDPLLGKLIVSAGNRRDALQTMRAALQASNIAGIETNLEYLRHVTVADEFVHARHSTRTLNDFSYIPLTIEVLQPGVQTTVQDWPGRRGYWDVGVPPSGPMDARAHRLANRLLDNPDSAAALEITLAGPTLRFNCDTRVAITGADMRPCLNDGPVPMWESIDVRAGDVLRMEQVSGEGYRAYLAVQDGFDVPDYLHSKSTFTLGRFGGHGGRALQVGDTLRLHQSRTDSAAMRRRLAVEARPGYEAVWQIDVMYGPYGAPDYFTVRDIEVFFSTDWEVHYNSSRTGIRLIGPKPEWARPDGDEAGLHPSNIHDCAYAVGTVDFTGDMPVILAVDGPSLGGFVCPATIIQADLWKIGQLKPGDKVRFRPVTVEYAARKEQALERAIDGLQACICDKAEADRVDPETGGAVVATVPAEAGKPRATFRQAGDRYLLMEYGEMVLDIRLRFRIHALMLKLKETPIGGVIDLTPGIRSLQVHFDSRIVDQAQLLRKLIDIEASVPPVDELEVPARVVHLPLAWDHSATRVAIEKYTLSVNPDAPWCPSNIEFIRRINGLDDIEAVKEIVFKAHYLVMGLGDVYLGAPVATPLDPRHRLVTTKYNPARTWTPENAVGIGGSYLCIYGMEGPGGYQFVGRTLQMWNRFKQTADFKDGKPWLLRFFDQIRFFPVTEAALEQHRIDFINGRYKLNIVETTFNAGKYSRFLQENTESIRAFKARQQAAFDAERERWAARGIVENAVDPVEAVESGQCVEIPEGCIAHSSHVPGNCWAIAVKPGDRVNEGDVLIVVESMKMEIEVQAPRAGIVKEILCQPGGQIAAGQVLAILQTG